MLTVRQAVRERKHVVLPSKSLGTGHYAEAAVRGLRTRISGSLSAVTLFQTSDKLLNLFSSQQNKGFGGRDLKDLPALKHSMTVFPRTLLNEIKSKLLSFTDIHTMQSLHRRYKILVVR